MKKLLATLIALMLIVPAALAAAPAPAPATIGQAMADFEGTLVTGETFKLSDYSGKAVLVNIWATWCPPCVAEMPDLQKLSEDYADDLVILGINAGEDQETVAKFLEERGYTYPVALDLDYSLGLNYFPTMYIPYTVVIDPSGVVTGKHEGLGTYEQFQELIDAALKGAA